MTVICIFAAAIANKQPVYFTMRCLHLPTVGLEQTASTDSGFKDGVSMLQTSELYTDVQEDQDLGSSRVI